MNLLIPNSISFVCVLVTVCLFVRSQRGRTNLNADVSRRSIQAVVGCENSASGRSCFSCPANEGFENFERDGLIDFAISDSSRLCTLVQIAPDGGSFKPVARSYTAHDWEPAPGDFSSLSLECHSEVCSIDLPLLPLGAKYQLKSFDMPQQYSAGSVTIARFLEQATFGPTRADIDLFESDSSTLTFAKWILDQQNSFPLTSHRAFFRKHMNAYSSVATQQGQVTHPCKFGARYRRYAFRQKDKDSFVTVESIAGTDKKVLKIDGFVRSVVDGPIHKHKDTKTVFDDGTYKIVWLNNGMNIIGGAIWMVHPTASFTRVSFNGTYGNPAIHFESGITPNVLLDIPLNGASPIDSLYFKSEKVAEQEIKLNADMTGSACESLGEPGNPLNPVFASYEGKYWIHDPRMETFDNTVESPAVDGGGLVMRRTSNIINPEHAAVCANVPRTFLNEDNCQFSMDPAACSVGNRIYEWEDFDGELPDFYLDLTPENIRAINNVTGSLGPEKARYIYAVEGLRLSDDQNADLPCTHNTRSRWLKVPCSGAAALVNPEVHTIFQRLLKSENASPNLRDVWNWISDDCPSPVFGLTDFEVEESDGICWLNVHPDHWNVYDFTVWTQTHPGNLPPRNPIKEFAEAGLSTLTFPNWHDMNRWQGNKGSFGLAGRLYDRVHYYAIPGDLRTHELSEHFDFTSSAITFSSSTGVLVCGSPSEVSNDLSLGGSQGRGAYDSYVNEPRTTSNDDFARQKKTTWTNIALTAEDQLRQRVAWALSQILVISPNANGIEEVMTENLVSYYDIFVRNAFGSYRQVLKEVAFSPIMARMLTFFKSKSTAYTWERSGNVEFADENFAREVMQLFSTGLTMMHTNGTKVIDKNGDPVNVYDNDDIMEYARVWTGFNSQPWRGNTEIRWQNQIDPLRVDVRQRDPFPKMGLNRKYIGQDSPLCIDLPKHHFLKRGATYRLLGRTANPELHTADPPEWHTAENVKRLTLESTGMLFAVLCGSSNPESCEFASKVVLENNLLCSGEECNVDTLRTVEVATGIFYEYVRPPCVYQAFFNDAKMVVRRTDWWRLTCADPRTTIASTACCDATNQEWIDVYWGEKVTFATAQDRCNGKDMCSRWPRPSCDTSDPSIGSYCLNKAHFWTNDPCKVRVKIDSDEKVAIVHAPVDVESHAVSRLVQNDTKTLFRVDWSGGDINSITANCTSFSSCDTTIDDKCICDVSVLDEQVYFEGDSPNGTDVLITLQVAAFDPRLTGISSPSGTNGEVVWYNPSAEMSSETIFEVTDENGIRRWRKNMKSTVTLFGTNLSFRNPVHHISLVEPEARDAYFETDSAIDHYLQHPNTAPFIAIRLAQRFGISNPSPRYVKAIATAFRTGSYSHESITFGTGEYGDLAATVACVLLDREARTILLDADPSHGSLREPIIKLIGLMRSMEFKLHDDAPFVDFDSKLTLKIGQMAHAQPNVFSFFLPEYKPSGPVAQASLTAPEAQVLTGPRIVETLNGLSSLVKFGLSKCWGGFRVNYDWDNSRCNLNKWGKSKNEGSIGKLSFEPTKMDTAQAITDELATLLTAGRLSVNSREIIDQVVDSEPDPIHKLVKAQQLMLFSPEFHSTNVVRRSRKHTRQRPASPPAPSHQYKAVVYLMLEGGMDSYHMLAPHTCTGTNPSGQTLLEQYYDERINLAIMEAERSRIVGAANQPCSHFVVHENLEVVERLYKEGDLAFFANTGVLNKPVNQDNYNTLTKTQLFGHNTMTEEAQRIDAYEKVPGTGVLGRMCDTLASNGFIARPVTIEHASIATIGVPGTGSSPLLVSPYSTNDFNPKPIHEYFDPRPFIDELNDVAELQSSLYGETWSAMLQTALYDNELLLDAVSKTRLQTEFPSGDFAEKMKTIATLVAAREKRGVDRDVFYASVGGWDHHEQMKSNLASKFSDLNAALSAFEREMKAQGTWKNVTLLITSDFARTLTPNSGEGSDHAWGGHYFMMGGAVKGARIHGEYPSDITVTGPLNVGRGRFIPTTSWESVLNSVLQWMGVPDSKLDHCLPNRKQTGAKLFTKEEVFE